MKNHKPPHLVALPRGSKRASQHGHESPSHAAVTDKKGLRPPAGLSDEACAWWRATQSAYDVSDPGGVSMLDQAAQALDRANEARALLKRDGLVVMDRFGQLVPHPASRVLAAAESSFRGMLRLLNLSPDVKGDK
jgi:phage terminase small subunit